MNTATIIILVIKNRKKTSKMSDDENYFHAEPEVQPARKGKRKAAGVQQEMPPPRLSRKTKQGHDRVLRLTRKQAEEEARKILSRVPTRQIAHPR